MLRDFHWRGWHHLDHLPPTRLTESSQPIATLRTIDDLMLHDARGHFPSSSVIVLGLSLLARLLFAFWRLEHIGFDKGGRWRFLLLQLFDLTLGFGQLLAQGLIFGHHRIHLFQPLQRLSQLLFQFPDFFLWCHAPSLAEKVLSEQYQ